jgi:integrase
MAKKDGIFVIRTNIFQKVHRSGAVSWIVRWRSPKSGKWKKVSAGKDAEEARAIEAKIRLALMNGEDPELIRASDVPNFTVADVLDRFYGHSRFLGASETWRIENRRRLEKYIRARLGSVSFAELNQDMILKLYISIRDEGMSRATIHKVHTLFCGLADLYQEIRPDSVNVPRQVKFGKYFPKRAPKREINFLTPEELERLYKVVARSHQRLLLPLVKFLANTGMRRAEALNLKWTDIDQGSGFIQIRMSKTGRARNIPIDPGAWDAIKYLEGRGEYVFTYPNGSRPDMASFRRPLVNAAKKAGITKRIDLHTLRHSYGSNQIRAGWGLKKVSMLLGHSDISMTANIYTHLLDGDLKVADQHARVFDKANESLDSEVAGGRHQFAAKVLADLIRAGAARAAVTGEDPMASIEAEIDGILRAAANAAGLQVLAVSAGSQAEMQVNGQSGVRAPHMPRKSDEREFLNEREGEVAPDFSWINGILDHLKNGRGNWIYSGHPGPRPSGALRAFS